MNGNRKMRIFRGMLLLVVILCLIFLGQAYYHSFRQRQQQRALEELREIKEGQSHLEDSMEDLKTQLQRDYTYMTQCLQEERYRWVPPGFTTVWGPSGKQESCSELWRRLQGPAMPRGTSAELSPEWKRGHKTSGRKVLLFSRCLGVFCAYNSQRGN